MAIKDILRKLVVGSNNAPVSNEPHKILSPEEKELESYQKEEYKDMIKKRLIAKRKERFSKFMKSGYANLNHDKKSKKSRKKDKEERVKGFVSPERVERAINAPAFAQRRLRPIYGEPRGFLAQDNMLKAPNTFAQKRKMNNVHNKNMFFK